VLPVKLLKSLPKQFTRC